MYFVKRKGNKLIKTELESKPSPDMFDVNLEITYNGYAIGKDGLVVIK